VAVAQPGHRPQRAAAPLVRPRQKAAVPPARLRQTRVVPLVRRRQTAAAPLVRRRQKGEGVQAAHAVAVDAPAVRRR
jgi:hypothetical protein